MKKTLSNFIYQSFYQLLILILPIITLPIVSRSLGPEGVGQYKFISTFSGYFVLIAGLGLQVYGVRETASKKNDRDRLKKTFWELEILNIAVGFFVLVFYLLLILFFKPLNLYLIQSITIIGALLDISWFFAGIERFKAISLVNIFVKLISFLAIVYFIHRTDDLGIYFLIQTFSVVASQIILWIFIPTDFYNIRGIGIHPFGHFKPALNYLWSKMLINLYTSMTVVFLGLYASKGNVAYYGNAIMLINIIVSVITTLDTVLLPRMASLFENDKSDQMLSTLKKSLHLQLFVTIPAMVGLSLVSKYIVVILMGNKFIPVTSMLAEMSPLVVAIPLSVSITRQYLVAINDIKSLNMAIVISAMAAVVFNNILIPLFGSQGAIITTLLVELFVLIWRISTLYSRTEFRFNYILIFKYFFCSFVMLIFLKIMFLISTNIGIFSFLIDVFFAILIYMFCALALKAVPLEFKRAIGILFFGKK
ncbi:hypothetical protein ATW93_10060 [Oenococcus oeni]|nr:hypothetical protein ATW92_09570 [Oenococcus oeni]OIL11214.1 hypothetical protein ATW93_10060 [Oenococcus oeni]